MVDVVYFYKAQYARWNELLYSLRALTTNLKGYRNIYFCADLPAFKTQNIIKIPFSYNVGKTDYPSCHNTNRKIYMISNMDELTDDVILMNDDIYINKETHVDNYILTPFLEKVNVNESSMRSSRKYIQLLYKTFTYLKSIGIDKPYNFETHTPMRFNRILMKNLIDEHDLINDPKIRWTMYYNLLQFYHSPITPEYKACFYGHFSNVSFGNMPYDQLKKICDNAQHINHDDAGLTGELKRYLREKYSEKCPLEL